MILVFLSLVVAGVHSHSAFIMLNFLATFAEKICSRDLWHFTPECVMNWPESTPLWQDILLYYSQQKTQQETSWSVGSHYEESKCWCIKTVDSDGLCIYVWNFTVWNKYTIILLNLCFSGYIQQYPYYNFLFLNLVCYMLTICAAIQQYA